MVYEELVEKVTTGIKDILSDMSVTKSVTIQNLNGLKDELDILIESLESDIEDNEEDS